MGEQCKHYYKRTEPEGDWYYEVVDDKVTAAYVPLYVIGVEPIPTLNQPCPDCGGLHYSFPIDKWEWSKHPDNIRYVQVEYLKETYQKVTDKQVQETIGLPPVTFIARPRLRVTLDN